MPGPPRRLRCGRAFRANVDGATEACSSCGAHVGRCPWCCCWAPALRAIGPCTRPTLPPPARGPQRLCPPPHRTHLPRRPPLRNNPLVRTVHRPCKATTRRCSQASLLRPRRATPPPQPFRALPTPPTTPRRPPHPRPIRKAIPPTAPTPLLPQQPAYTHQHRWRNPPRTLLQRRPAQAMQAERPKQPTPLLCPTRVARNRSQTPMCGAFRWKPPPR